MEKKEKQGLKIQHLEIENFKNIDKRVVDIGGRSLLILGKNASGKSSIIQAILSPLNTKVIPSEPIKDGEERAKISLKIAGHPHGKEEEYTLDMYFTPGNKKGRIKVYNKDGEDVKTPSTFIKSLIGNISFDIFSFLNQNMSDKITTLKNLSGNYKEIDLINKEIINKKEERKYDKKRSEELEMVIKNHGYSDEELHAYSHPVDIAVYQQELSLISESITKYNKIKNGVSDFSARVEKISERLREIEEEKESLLSEMAEKNEKIIRGKEWLEKNNEPSVEEVNKKITLATQHNHHHNNVMSFSEKQKEMMSLKKKIMDHDADIEKLENKKSEEIKKSQLPVEGLTFTEDNIFINGLPLEAEQINKAALFDIGVEIAMAINPNLKTIFLHDGSLFDKEHLKSVIHKIEERGYQAIVELVSEDNDVVIKFTENEA